MGILNITPDSFSDPGKFYAQGKPLLDAVLSGATQMVEAGAALLDVGGESTRPGAVAISRQEELDRVMPVIEALAGRLENVILSVDTSDAEVMTAAAAAGVGLINDVRALQKPGALQAAAATGLPVVLTHMQGSPDCMQNNPCYQNVVTEVGDFLVQRKACVQAAGISAQKIIIDPGIGFGKSLEHNLRLIRKVRCLRERLNTPIMLGVSRKRMLRAITGRTQPAQRLASSVTAAVTGIRLGADIVRVHDVEATLDAIRTWQAIEQA